MYGKVAMVGVVGNEDGAHKVTADVYQALNDVGFTTPAQGGPYWRCTRSTTRIWVRHQIRWRAR